MSIKVTVKEKRPGCFIIAPVGPIDTDTHQALAEKIDPLVGPYTKAIILDMAGVDYISSIGLSLIFRVKQALEGQGSAFVMVRVQPNVQRIFKAVKMIPSSMFATLQEADAYLDAYLKDVGENKI
ncbi:MAG: STAS domain-containing protein [Candidatus Omnitrophica bacterium]|nr:STAS domain-containing protein [Candidatus Omnitrophota bacterium]MCM8791495.1 STAS domain-containing protein [Candidatus Omnitrophota bacterium]